MRRAVLLAVVCLSVTGCGGGGDADGDEETGAATGTPIRTITIEETEYALKPATITVQRPGTYAFEVVNKGTIAHALEIEGQGIEEETDVLDAGESATLTVEIKSGSYELYCPVDDHKDRGMTGDLAVRAGPGVPTETTDSEEDSGSDY